MRRLVPAALALVCVALLSACVGPLPPASPKSSAKAAAPAAEPAAPVVDPAPAGPPANPEAVAGPGQVVEQPPVPPKKMTDPEYMLQLVRIKRINDPSWMPDLVRDPRDVKVYDHCKFAYKVLQVIDSESCLIEYGGDTLALYMSTSGVVDGDRYEVEGIIRNAGRVQYRTVLGATRTVKAIRYTGRMPELPPIVRPPQPEKKPPPPPPPLPRHTLTPPKGEPILLGEAQYFIATAKREVSQKAAWLKAGKLKELTEPAEVEVVSTDREYSKVRLDGREWYVESRHLPADKK